MNGSVSRSPGYGAAGGAAISRKRSPVPTCDGGRPLLGHLPELRRDPLGLFSRAARLGDVVRLRLGRDVYLLNHPDYVQRVLQDHPTNYRKSFFYGRMKPLIGDGLLTSEGASWKRQRRLAQPAFHKDRLAAFAGIMAKHTGAMLDRWAGPASRGDPVDVAAEMMRLTLTVVCHALFGLDVLGDTGDAGRAITTAIRLTNERFSALVNLPTALPTRRNLRFARARRVLVRLVDDIIVARRGAPPREDLLGLLMEARDVEGGEGLSDRELRDEVMTMVLAGHETTASALSWAFFLLSRAPSVGQRLHQESAGVLGKGAPTLEDLPRLRTATLVHQEATRLYPPAWIIGRQAIAADAFGPFEVPAGAAVSISPWLLHRDARYWQDPERFDPDRFSPEASSGRPRFAYFPFAAGPRMCIGNGFAMMEMQIALSMVAARHRLEPVPGRSVEAEPSVTLRPRGGIWMTVHRW